MPNDVTLDPPITRTERLLARAAGMENIDVDDPETRSERYLKAICDRLDSGGGLPAITDVDDGKVLTADSGEWVAANPSGGLPTPTSSDVGKVATVVENSGSYEYGLETPSAGGGVLVVAETREGSTGTLNKTIAEIMEAQFAVVYRSTLGIMEERFPIINVINFKGTYTVTAIEPDGGVPSLCEWTASSESGYPTRQYT